LGEQRAVRGAVENTDLARLVHGQEAFAALLGQDLRNRAVAQLEVANVLQGGLAILVAHHEPLADAALRVANHQRDAAQQGTHRGDLARAAQQLVTAVELLATQVEHVHARLAIEGEQPLLARVDEHGLDRLGETRQLEAMLISGDLASEQVFLTLQTQSMQFIARGSGQQQARSIQADTYLLQRTTLGVQLDRLRAVGVNQLGGDGFLIVGVTERVGVFDDQRLAIAQAQDKAAAAGRVFAQGDNLAVGRQGYGFAAQDVAAGHREKLCLSVCTQAQSHLVLLFDGQQQGRRLLRQPGRLHGLFGLQVGALEHGQDDLSQVEEDQGNGAQHSQAANGDVPAGQTVLESAYAPLALEGRSVEIQPRRVGRSSHGFIRQFIHARNSATATKRSGLS
jgi:hypothetical protein